MLNNIVMSLHHKKCNIEKYKKGFCGQEAKWKHPRWPTGYYCDEHKETLSSFWPDDWKRLPLTKD